MHRYPLLILFLSSAIAAAQPPGGTQPILDGYRLYELCRHTDPAATLRPSSRYLAAQCRGYVSGVLDAASRFADVRPCLPDWLGPGQLSEIVTRYLAYNPEQLHRPATDLVLEAIGESYGTLRCP